MNNKWGKVNKNIERGDCLINTFLITLLSISLLLLSYGKVKVLLMFIQRVQKVIMK